MKKLASIAAAMIVATAIAGFALAGTSNSGSLKDGTTSYTVKFSHPKKIILYPESSQVRTSYSIVCLKGTKVSHFSRTFTTGFTRNLLWHIPRKQDVCYVSVAAATKTNRGQIVVQATS